MVLAYGKDPENMDMDATQKYLKDMSVGLEDVTCLVAFHAVQSPTIGEIRKEGFIKGWTELGYGTANAISIG
jgi:DCN1-like protein 1/2